MKTHLDTGYAAPDFDSHIATWLTDFTPDPFDYGGPPLRVGILSERGGVKTVYRAIDGDGVNEMRAVYDYLESLGLTDLSLYDHPRFNCIYGMPDHAVSKGESFVVTALSPR